MFSMQFSGKHCLVKHLLYTQQPWALCTWYGKFLPSLRVLAEMSPLQRAPVPFGHPCHRVCPLPDTVMILLSLLVLLTPVWNIVEQAGVSGFLSFSVVPGTEKAY